MGVPLSRNRDYKLLWSARALSEVGSNTTRIAFPLLAFAISGSPAVTGLATAAYAAAQLMFSLPAGALLDRWNRKRVMLCCEATAVATLALLVTGVGSGVVQLWYVVAAALVLGCCTALFDPAEEASLPRVVAPDQLSTAVALNGARASLGTMAGTSLGGFLFGLARTVPFLADVIFRVCSLTLLLFVRIPSTERPREPARRLPKEIWTGLRWVWNQRTIRTISFAAVVLNLLFQSLYLIAITTSLQTGVPMVEIGLMGAMLGAGGVLGALVAAKLYRILGLRLVLALVFWTIALLAPLLALVQSGLLMGVLFFLMTFLTPTATTAIVSYQLTIAPDHLRGRISSLANLFMGISASAGPALGGLLVALIGGTPAIIGSAAAIGLTALLVTLSRSLRNPAEPRDPTHPIDLEKTRE